VMLPHYSPFKVAENFRLLETMFPGRIDLGIGRAPGSDMATAQALAYGSPVGVEYFVNKVADLKALLEDKPLVTKGLENVFAAPRTISSPEIWMLGSSAQSAHYAAHFGLPYSFAHFIAPDQSLNCVEQYRAACIESGTSPRANLGVFVLCAETNEKADDLAACRDLWRLRFEKGDPGPCPSIAEARQYQYSDEEKHRLTQRRKHLIGGTPDLVKEKLIALAEEHKINEMVVVTICHDFKDRADSYRLLAEAFQLTNN
ncbi:MAG: MsnO8 family LLM class oxidoreductase, partial [Proteobacteria bacterium]|nr:MsnO8 family LLM class oxidoreductase [Pseudomonadota bacterium]